MVCHSAEKNWKRVAREHGIHRIDYYCFDKPFFIVASRYVFSFTRTSREAVRSW